MQDYTAILTERGFSIRDNLERIFSKHELSLLVEYELFSLDTIEKLVKKGLGWSALPKQYCDDELVRLDIKYFAEKIKLCSYCHQQRDYSKIIQYVGGLPKKSLSYNHHKGS